MTLLSLNLALYVTAMESGMLAVLSAVGHNGIPGATSLAAPYSFSGLA
jgi:hypothetical protein